MQNFTGNDGCSEMLDVFKRTLRHEGLRGFYKGLVPDILKVASSGRDGTRLKASILAVGMKAKGLLIKI